jgi:hypothetical protein
MAGIYYLLQDSTGFDRMMHGKSPKKQEKQRSLEDFIVSMQRVYIFMRGLLIFRFLLSMRRWRKHRRKNKNQNVDTFLVMSWTPEHSFFEPFFISFLNSSRGCSGDEWAS